MLKLLNHVIIIVMTQYYYTVPKYKHTLTESYMFHGRTKYKQSLIITYYTTTKEYIPTCII